MMEVISLWLVATFAIGTFWFWLAFSGLFFWMVVLSWCDEDDIYSTENGFWTTIAFLVLIGFMWLATGVSPKEFFTSNSFFDIVLSILGYIGIGFGWSLFKWRGKVKRWWKNKVKRGSGSISSKPEVKDNLDSIVYWIAYFPFSMVSYFIGEWLLKIFDKLKELIMKLRFVYSWVEGNYAITEKDENINKQ